MMTLRSCLGQLILLSTVLFNLTSSLPPWERTEDKDGLIRSELSRPNTLSMFARSYVDALTEARLRGPGMERRQLGDIEFSNRYAEYLRSKAKHSSICAFLRRMQGVKKSGLVGEAERVNDLLRQYMCPSTSGWSSGL